MDRSQMFISLSTPSSIKANAQQYERCHLLYNLGPVYYKTGLALQTCCCVVVILEKLDIRLHVPWDCLDRGSVTIEFKLLHGLCDRHKYGHSSTLQMCLFYSLEVLGCSIIEIIVRFQSMWRKMNGSFSFVSWMMLFFSSSYESINGSGLHLTYQYIRKLRWFLEIEFFFLYILQACLIN